MKSISRITAIIFLVTAALLCGCDADTVVLPSESNSQTTSVASATLSPSTETTQQTAELEILYHPEAIWTPSSVNTSRGSYTVETENGSFEIGRYGSYDENWQQIEIDPDQKIAIAVYFSAGFPHSDIPVDYYELPDEIIEVMPEEIYEECIRLGYCSDYVFLEYWLESQGFEVVKDHAGHYSWFLHPTGDVPLFTDTLIITTPRQLAQFKMPYPRATCRFYGAYYEKYAPADYVPSTEPEILYHPEALRTPSSVDLFGEFDTIETENGNFYIRKYGYYDKNGNQIKVAPDQKIAIAADCHIGFSTGTGWDCQYSDLPDEIKAVISEELFLEYTWNGCADYIFLENWLESQGFEVLKDHMCHYSREKPGAAVLIITTPRQLAAFKMPYPQAMVAFWGAKYEDFAPELMKYAK